MNTQKLEVVVIPVSDVDRAKNFYVGLGWRLDADFDFGPAARILQVTPPGSQASVIFGRGVTPAAPGTAQGVVLVVDDVETARAELRARGAEVSVPFHGGNFFGDAPRTVGPDPDQRSYYTYASFTDPDGNGWLLQEVKTRLPGRVVPLEPSGLESLLPLLREAEVRHGVYQATAPAHSWWEWYGRYIVARQHGRSPEDAAADAAATMPAAAA